MSSLLMRHLAAVITGTAAYVNPLAPTWKNQIATNVMYVGYAYNFNFSASATEAATYSVIYGALPPGLTLNATTGLVSGTLTAPGAYSFVVAATNSHGTIYSPYQQISGAYLPMITGLPVVGVPASYTIAGFNGTVDAQQWYNNDGTSGPAPIAGATGATYTPTSSGYLSVHAKIDGVWHSSFEFANTGAVVRQSPVLTLASPSSGLPYFGKESGGTIGYVSVGAPALMRVASGTSYIETAVAPGNYPGNATPPALGDPTLMSTTIYGANVYQLGQLAPAQTVVPPTLAPAAASRPVASTGVGFFVANGAVYDANGNKFKIRGINATHIDSNTAGLPNTKCNAQRLNMSLNPASTTYFKPKADAAIAAHSVPILAMLYWEFTGNVSISGTVMTVNSVAIGNLYVGAVIPAGTGYGSITITSFGTGTGKTGTYNIASAQTISNVTVSTAVAATGSWDLNLFNALIQTWVDNMAAVQPYESQAMINLVNEWGPPGSASNTVWRDAYATATTGAIAKIRAAGWKGPIVIDAPASGQDSGTAYSLINHAPAILASDPQANIICSLHPYGWAPGQISGTAQSLHAVAVANPGLAYIFGEFGPSLSMSSSMTTWTDPREMMAAAEAYDIGWLAWAWNDQTGYNLLASGGTYVTSASSDLNVWGRTVVLDPVYGTTLSTPATVV